MAPDPKKRKLTFAERQVEKVVKRQEKEQKEKEKLEARAAKDDEKRRKEEEKDAARKAREAVKEERKKAKDAVQQEKEAVREEKKKAKDAVQQEKEAEKKRKEAEVLKKKQSQMRIGAFFARPASASTPPATPDVRSTGPVSRRSSTASIDIDMPLAGTDTPVKATNPEFNNWILPFFVSDLAEVAPFNRFHRTAGSLGHAEFPLNQGTVPEPLRSRFRQRQRRRPIRPVKAIMEQLAVISTSVDHVVDDDSCLASVPYKYLQFREDVRPPYQGTFTRTVSLKSSYKLARNPVHRGLPDINYDYDSEAEWEEPEDGDDDLMDEDEMSEDEAGEDEMDDFLDDEAEPVKRRLLVGEMEAKSSGVCWEGSGVQPENQFDLSVYRMDVLHDATSLPIDPYSTVHWSDIGKPSPKKKESKTSGSGSGSEMQPPRLPLMTLDANTGNLMPPRGTLGTPTEDDKPAKALAGVKAKSGTKAVKMVPSDVLPAFRAAVEGSTLSKVGLIEVLKDQFPKCPKDAIKDTLTTIAVKQGGKDKKWVLV
ncbi:hypothetical protein B0A52_09679 [Exophiala mesophila]|uniref:Chromatin assembly factor 1 subunit A n=1 Tax=Exophiala mesophila TaxID=212818 RepID=A0A438MU26_EXOME|nr:hypothetical protein B0A52_09679 [Exophiala mesophila]